MQAAGCLLRQGPLRQGRALPPAGEAAVPVGTEAEQEVDFKEVSEEQALSILKVGPAAAAAAPAPLARPERPHGGQSDGWVHASVAGRQGSAAAASAHWCAAARTPNLDPCSRGGWRSRRRPPCPSMHACTTPLLMHFLWLWRSLTPCAAPERVSFPQPSCGVYRDAT